MNGLHHAMPLRCRLDFRLDTNLYRLTCCSMPLSMDELSVQELRDYLNSLPREAAIEQSCYGTLLRWHGNSMMHFSPFFLTETEIDGRLLLQFITEDSYSEFKEPIPSQLSRLRLKAAAKYHGNLCKEKTLHKI